VYKSKRKKRGGKKLQHKQENFIFFCPPQNWPESAIRNQQMAEISRPEVQVKKEKEVNESYNLHFSSELKTKRSRKYWLQQMALKKQEYSDYRHSCFVAMRVTVLQ